MSSLRVFGRRPASHVRQKHGGFNSTFPMNYHTVIEQAALQDAFDQAVFLHAEALKQRGGVEIVPENNILNFAERSHRLGRKRLNSRANRASTTQGPRDTPKV